MSKPLLDPNKKKNSFISNSSTDDQLCARSLPVNSSRKSSRSPSLRASPKTSFGTKGNPNTKKSMAVSSFGSIGSYDNYNVDDDQEELDPKGANFTLKGPNGETFVGSFEGEDRNRKDLDEFQLLSRDPIFRQLCNKDEYKQDNNCKVCFAKFSLMKSRKNCHFCGEAVCDDHSKKKRGDPDNPTEYHRICDTCEKKYINYIILKDFNKKLRERDDLLKQYEEKMKIMQKRISDAQRELDNSIVRKAKNEKNTADQINYLQNEIFKLKEETKKCDRENVILSQEFNEAHQRREQVENEYNEAKTEVERLEREVATLNNQLEAIGQDIVQLNKKLKQYDEAMTKARMNRANDNSNAGPSSNHNHTYFGASYLGESNSVLERNDSLLSGVDFANRYSTENPQTPKGYKVNPKLKAVADARRKENNKRPEHSGSHCCSKGCNLF